MSSGAISEVLPLALPLRPALGDVDNEEEWLKASGEVSGVAGKAPLSDASRLGSMCAATGSTEGRFRERVEAGFEGFSFELSSL